MSDPHNFQVNMKGIIDLLSNHLYSNPNVFVRELLQNCCDAIEARRIEQSEHQGRIEIELLKATPPNAPTLIVRDNGIGLTEAEVHQFLATIGQSSKRESINRENFIGQFGIGLLSAFLVCEEIVVVTKSTQADSKTIQWKGRADGTYRISTIEQDFEPGTEVFIRAKQGCFDFFDFEFVRDTVSHFGKYLGYGVSVSCGDRQDLIAETPPWKFDESNGSQLKDAYLQFGKESLGAEFFDAIPVQLDELGVEGVIFVLPRANRSTRNHLHRIYLKNMLLTESVDNLLPDWAFYVTSVLNVSKLRPTAARESFYEDEQLSETRFELGKILKDYIVDLADANPRKLQQLIGLHNLSMKALAVEDDDFYQTIIQWLPFETNMGHMTVAEYRQIADDPIRYVSTVDQFRQISSVAAAQSRFLFNGGFAHDNELLEKLNFQSEFPNAELIEPDALAQDLEELTELELESVASFLSFANEVLGAFDCETEIRKFQPGDLPALLTSNRDAEFLRSVEQVSKESDSLFSDVLGDIAAQFSTTARTQLCLNFENSLIRTLVGVSDRNILRQTIEMLYVQALLLGRFPIKPKEMRLLGSGMLGMIESSLNQNRSSGS